MSRRCLSIEDVVGKFTDPSQIAMFTDGGAGAEKVRTYDERRTGNYYTERADDCRTALRRKRRSNLIPVFNLIVKNGSFREYSIAELMDKKRKDYETAKKLYFRHRKKILFFFKVQ